MLTRSREAARRTISHWVSGEPRRHVSPTVKPVFSGGTEGAGEVQMRERKKRHRSNGHHKVYHISIQLESEKLPQSQLGGFWRKKLTRGKNPINITVLNQYIKPSSALSQGCSVMVLTAVILTPPDWVCKQCGSGASGLSGHGMWTGNICPHSGIGWVYVQLGRLQPSHPSFQNQALAQWKHVSEDRATLCSGKDGPMEATEGCLCRSPPAGTARAQRLEALKPGVDPEVLNGNVRGSQVAVPV